MSFKQDIIDGKVKVVTYYGEMVEIVKWNCKGNYPILAVIDDGDTSDTCFYDEEGLSSSKKERIYILTDEPESEDERIRSRLLDFFNSFRMANGVKVKWEGLDVQKVIAWLEKQEHNNFIVEHNKFLIDDAYQRGYDKGVKDTTEKQSENQKEHNICDTCDYNGSCINPCPAKLIGKQGEKGVVFRDTFGYEEGRQKGQEEGIMMVLDNPQKYGLEKLEQKPTEDDDREYACQSPENYTRRELMIYNLGIINGKKMFEDNIKEDQQKAVWSEEDEQIFNVMESELEKYIMLKQYGTPLSVHDIEWFKSLRPQNTWKPNDEQIEALDIALKAGIQLGTWEETALKSLKEQLFKLKKPREE